MNLLPGKIWQSISNTLRNEDLYPRKKDLLIEEIDNHFFIKHKRRFLWIFYIWEYIEYDDIQSMDIPVSFNSLDEAKKFINEISCD